MSGALTCEDVVYEFVANDDIMKLAQYTERITNVQLLNEVVDYVVTNNSIGKDKLDIISDRRSRLLINVLENNKRSRKLLQEKQESETERKDKRQMAQFIEMVVDKRLRQLGLLK